MLQRLEGALHLVRCRPVVEPEKPELKEEQMNRARLTSLLPAVGVLLALLAVMPERALAQLETSGPYPQIAFDDTDDELHLCTSYQDWTLWADGGASDGDLNNLFKIKATEDHIEGCYSTDIVTIEFDGSRDLNSSRNSIFIESNGDILLADGGISIDRVGPINSSAPRLGIGTVSPGYALDIHGSNPEIQLLDETSNSIAHIQYNSRELVFEGAAGQQDIVRIEDMAPANSLYMATDGDIGLGTASPATRLHVMGGTTIEGDLSVLSSRTAKSDFEPLVQEDVLMKLESLEILSWRYIDDSRQARHIGPTAEQFHDTFGTGADPRHLSPMDAAGVALASSQELLRLVKEQAAELSRLRTERDEILNRLIEIEARLASDARRSDTRQPGI